MSELLEQGKLPFSTLHQLRLPLIFIGTQGSNEGTRHEHIAIPLLVRRHDIPGRFICAAPGERLLIGLLILVPVGALRPISSRNFPGVRLILLLGQQDADEMNLLTTIENSNNNSASPLYYGER